MIFDYTKRDLNIATMNNYMLAKTLLMFEYENLPETMPRNELEKLLQVNGYCFVCEHKGDIYALTGGLGGEQDVYGNPTQIIVNNVALDLYKTFDLDEGVLFKNDDFMLGLMPLLEKYHWLLSENYTSMIIHGYANRMTMLFSASDDKTKESAEQYLQKIVNGEISVIADSPIFDGIRVHNKQSESKISDLIEYHQYVKGSLFNELGLNAKKTLKKERLITAEVEQQDESLFPLLYSMMNSRLTAIKKINEKFNLNIEVDFGSVWNVKEKQFVDDIVDEVDETLPENGQPVDESSESSESLESSESNESNESSESLESTATNDANDSNLNKRLFKLMEKSNGSFRIPYTK